MSKVSHPGVATLALHGAGARHTSNGPLLTPLVQSTTFVKQSVEIQPEYAYSRVSNPTVSELERRLGALEQAPPAICFASGMAAETALLMAVLKAGDHVVCGGAVYGGTVRLLREIFTDFGVTTTFADTSDTDSVARAMTPRTKLVFVETPANPTLVLTDIAAAAEIAHGAGALLAVDNTFLTGALQRPLDLGADISVASTTKQTEGHSAAMGGAVVSRNEELLDRVRFVRKSTGAIISPLNAWLTIQGLKTLPLRLEAQSRHAHTVASWLAEHPRVTRVHYPGLASFPQRALADRQHRGAHGNVLSFETDGGFRSAASFAAGLKLCSLVEHVGSVETLATHSASMTHADVPREHRLAVGVTDGLIRLSIGLEEPEDVIEDLRTALEAAHAAPAPTCADRGASCCTGL